MAFLAARPDVAMTLLRCVVDAPARRVAPPGRVRRPRRRRPRLPPARRADGPLRPARRGRGRGAHRRPAHPERHRRVGRAVARGGRQGAAVVAPPGLGGHDATGHLRAGRRRGDVAASVALSTITHRPSASLRCAGGPFRHRRHRPDERRDDMRRRHDATSNGWGPCPSSPRAAGASWRSSPGRSSSGTNPPAPSCCAAAPPAARSWWSPAAWPRSASATGSCRGCAGDFAGELAVLGRRSHGADVVAETDVAVLECTAAELRTPPRGPGADPHDAHHAGDAPGGGRPGARRLSAVDPEAHPRPTARRRRRAGRLRCRPRARRRRRPRRRPHRRRAGSPAARPAVDRDARGRPRHDATPRGRRCGGGRRRPRRAP